MGNPNTLKSFIQWGVATYPADHYLLDIWDHGGGLDGVCWDDTSGTNMTVSQVQQAIAGASTHIDVIGFDACLMGMEEVRTSFAAWATSCWAPRNWNPGTAGPMTRGWPTLQPIPR